MPDAAGTVRVLAKVCMAKSGAPPEALSPLQPATLSSGILFMLTAMKGRQWGRALSLSHVGTQF